MSGATAFARYFCKPLFWLLLDAIITISPIQAQTACRDDVQCYACDSRKDTNCGAHWNETLVMQDPPLITLCRKGCCLKMVFESDDESESYVLRACTSNPDIMVETHLKSTGCIGHWKSKAKMCLCSAPRCNTAVSLTPPMQAIALFSASLSSVVSSIFLSFPP
uniref:UPAR/Ly6 domain-containing protein qvr n=1 Tax=Plectus sambesii TaxID=2011161 RepID=A0A914W819_9BILA